MDMKQNYVTINTLPARYLYQANNGYHDARLHFLWQLSAEKSVSVSKVNKLAYGFVDIMMRDTTF